MVGRGGGVVAVTLTLRSIHMLEVCSACIARRSMSSENLKGGDTVLYAIKAN